MSKTRIAELMLVSITAVSLTGCQNLPGNRGTQGAVIGGAGGATVGALLGGGHHRLLGGLLGGALGAGAGYLIGANTGKIRDNDTTAAQQAVVNAQQHPATAQDALRATTADINGDGFVTLDEVVAMRDAGLSDAQMLQRLQATGQVFELTPDQRQYLLNHGVSAYLVDQMQTINQTARNQLLTLPPAGSTVPPTVPPTSTIPQAVPPAVGTPPVISQPPPATIPQTY